MLRHRLDQAGDTIVEVLIASVIVSSVLVGGYKIANISIRQIRMAQERTEAQKIASGEIENHPTCSTPAKIVPPRYDVAFSCDASSTLKVKVTWASLRGGTDETSMYYRAAP